MKSLFLALLISLPAVAQFGHRSNPSWGGFSDPVKSPQAITAVNGYVSVATWGASTAIATITGTWNQTLQFSCSNDNWTTVTPIAAYALASGAVSGTGQTTTTTNGTFLWSTLGFQQCGVVATVWTSNTSQGIRVDADPASFFSASQASSPGHRGLVTIDVDAPVALTASDAVLTFQYNKSGSITTAQTTYPVTSGKTFRVQEVHCTLKQTSATAASAIVRLRLNTGGACVVGSGLVQTFQIPAPLGTAAAEVGNPPVSFPIGDGVELVGSSWNVCISAIGSSANGTIQCGITGYEY